VVQELYHPQFKRNIKEIQSSKSYTSNVQEGPTQNIKDNITGVQLCNGNCTTILECGIMTCMDCGIDRMTSNAVKGSSMIQARSALKVEDRRRLVLDSASTGHVAVSKNIPQLTGVYATMGQKVEGITGDVIPVTHAASSTIGRVHIVPDAETSLCSVGVLMSKGWHINGKGKSIIMTNPEGMNLEFKMGPDKMFSIDWNELDSLGAHTYSENRSYNAFYNGLDEDDDPDVPIDLVEEEQSAIIDIKQPLIPLNAQEIDRAKAARELHVAQGHLSNNALKNALAGGAWADQHLTPIDVINSDRVCGPCISCLEGN
jgi:hypothetical protein